MPVLLTILSVLAVWVFLTVLILGLFRVFKGLQGTRTSLERIAMGVRAIEKQAEPLAYHAQGLVARFDDTAGVLEEAGRRWRRTAAALGRIGPRRRNP